MSESLPFGNIRLNWLDKQGGVPPPQAPRAKKRRPNLANGLSSLSIQTERPREPEALPSYDESEETRNEVDEDDLLEPNPQSIDDDLEIELMPESSNRPGRSYTMSSSSENSDDESDLFSPMGQHRRHRQRQQPDTVEQPSPVREQMYGFEVEDVTTPELRGQKRREGSPRTERHKRHRSGADIDMDTDNVELRGRKHPRWRKNAHSFEPEKDRKSCSTTP